jgi:hypothetical protein
MEYRDVTEEVADVILATHGRDAVADSVRLNRDALGSVREYRWYLRSGYSLILEWDGSTGERYWWEEFNDY